MSAEVFLTIGAIASVSLVIGFAGLLMEMFIDED